MRTEAVVISERRKVMIAGLPPGRISLTPAGNAPIECMRVDLLYDLADAALRQATVWGHLADQRDVDRRASRLRRSEAATNVIVRRYSMDWPTGTVQAPAWLLELIELYRPGGGP